MPFAIKCFLLTICWNYKALFDAICYSWFVLKNFYVLRCFILTILLFYGHLDGLYDPSERLTSVFSFEAHFKEDSQGFSSLRFSLMCSSDIWYFDLFLSLSDWATDALVITFSKLTQLPPGFTVTNQIYHCWLNWFLMCRAITSRLPL